MGGGRDCSRYDLYRRSHTAPTIPENTWNQQHERKPYRRASTIYDRQEEQIWSLRPCCSSGPRNTIDNRFWHHKAQQRIYRITSSQPKNVGHTRATSGYWGDQCRERGSNRERGRKLASAKSILIILYFCF